jgi:hypothetical protein
VEDEFSVLAKGRSTYIREAQERCRSDSTEDAPERGLFESEMRPMVLQGLKPDVDLIGFIGTVENPERRGECGFVHSLVPKGEKPGAPSIRVFIHLGGPKAHGDTTEVVPCYKAFEIGE